MSVGEESGGEEGRHAVADLGEAGSEDAVVVEVEAVGEYTSALKQKHKVAVRRKIAF